MSYLIAAYAITAAALFGYGFYLIRERKSLSKPRKSNNG